MAGYKLELNGLTKLKEVNRVEVIDEEEYKLPKEFWKKWKAALLSGKYPQGKTYLLNRETNTYCCLGVACSVVGIDNNSLLDKNWIIDLSNDGFDLSDIPEDLATDEGLAAILAQMNDESKSFVEIVKWIEKNVDII